MQPRPSRPAFANPSIFQVAGALATTALGIAALGALVFFGGVACLISVPVIGGAILVHVACTRFLGDRYRRFLGRTALWFLRRSGVRFEGQTIWVNASGPGTMWEDVAPGSPKALPDHSANPPAEGGP